MNNTFDNCSDCGWRLDKPRPSGLCRGCEMSHLLGTDTPPILLYALPVWFTARIEEA
jgi:hypothetical protein